MINLELNLEEQAVLARILTSYRSDLRAEIARTDRRAFRDELKKDGVFLDKLLDRLNQEDSE